MRKTILALAILSGISLQANAQLSGDDLMDISDILNDTPTATAKTPEKEKPKTVEIKKTETVKTEKKPSSPVKETNGSKPAVTVIQTESDKTAVDAPVIEKSKTTPTLVVPVSGTNFVLNIKRLNKSIITKSLSKDEIAMGIMTGVADDHKTDKEVVEFADEANKNKIVSFSNYIEEPNVYIGKKVTIDKVTGKATVKEELGTLVYGYGYILQGKLKINDYTQLLAISVTISSNCSYSKTTNRIFQVKDYDKKNNRVSVRLDYTNKAISSYEESEVITTEGVLTKVKIPTIKTSVTSNVFWLKLETDSKQSIKVDDKHYLEVVMGRVLPYVQPVIAIDLKKIAADEKAAKEAAIKAEQDNIKAEAAAKEAEKLNAVKSENSLYEDLESELKK